MSYSTVNLTACLWMARIVKPSFFSGSYSIEVIRPTSEHTYKRHILGSSVSPWNDFCHPVLCCLSCMLCTKAALKLVQDLSFSCRKIPSREIWKFFRLYALACQFMSVFFKWSKSLQDKWPKGHIALVTHRKTKHFGTIWWNPWINFPKFLHDIPVTSLTYIPSFIPNWFRFGRV